jgi:transposase
MAALLGAPVSTGFVAGALKRFAQRLGAAGFDTAMKTALRAEEVFCGDETARHEARCDRAGVRGLRRLAVAAAGLKLRAV